MTSRAVFCHNTNEIVHSSFDINTQSKNVIRKNVFRETGQNVISTCDVRRQMITSTTQEEGFKINLYTNCITMMNNNCKKF